jgi:hypothetical protein
VDLLECCVKLCYFRRKDILYFKTAVIKCSAVTQTWVAIAFCWNVKYQEYQANLMIQIGHEMCCGKVWGYNADVIYGFRSWAQNV